MYDDDLQPSERLAAPMLRSARAPGHIMSDMTNVPAPREIARFGKTSVTVGSAEPARQRSAETIWLPDQGAFHVVVQKGRSFQRANPHIPVVVDRGRFLIVELPPNAKLKHEEADFAVLAADAQPLVFDVERAAARARRADVSALVDTLSEDQLRDKVEALAQLHTRHSSTAAVRAGADPCSAVAQRRAMRGRACRRVDAWRSNSQSDRSACGTRPRAEALHRRCAPRLGESRGRT